VRLLQELASSGIVMDDLDVGEGDDEDCELAPSVASSNLNLILVTNLNIRVVLCDCGRAYRVPDERAAAEDTNNEPNNNNVTQYCEFTETAVVTLPDALKERY
jgi:hypothetical protein